MKGEDYVRNLVNAYASANGIPQRVSVIEPFYRSTSFLDVAIAGPVSDSIADDPTIWYFTNLNITSHDDEGGAEINGYMVFKAKPQGAPVEYNFMDIMDSQVLTSVKIDWWKVINKDFFLWNKFDFQLDKVGALTTEYRYYCYSMMGYKITLA